LSWVRIIYGCSTKRKCRLHYINITRNFITPHWLPTFPNQIWSSLQLLFYLVQSSHLSVTIFYLLTLFGLGFLPFPSSVFYFVLKDKTFILGGLVLFCSVGVLECELRTLCLLCRCSTTWAILPAQKNHTFDLKD
jgi:hypothetical protein